MRGHSVQIAAVAAILVVALPCTAATLHVPANYATISQAMGAAVSGDTVAVGPGVWDQHVTLPGGYRVISMLKGGVTLRSTDGPDVTELRLNGGTVAAQASALWGYSYSEPIVVEGLRFTSTGVSTPVLEGRRSPK